MIWSFCQEFKAAETGIVMAKWKKSNWKSSLGLAFHIYESTCGEELSSKVGPEHTG